MKIHFAGTGRIIDVLGGAASPAAYLEEASET
jgi:hypothetical protein